MKKNKVVLVLFAILALLQLAESLYMVWRWEDILTTGSPYQWKTAPVDPYDALRGRYVDLWFKETIGPIIDDAKIDHGQTVYAMLGVDANGFAYITGISASKPVSGDYVEAEAGYAMGSVMNVTLPFKRFYMREDLAPMAETAYQQSAGKDGSITVRIKNGMGVVEQLYIGDKTIVEYLRNAAK